MARKRMIDPTFWSDEKVIELSFAERLLFIGYWNFADDNGVHPYSLRSLKAEIFPADDITKNDLNTILKGLIEKNLLIPFENDEFLFCPMWAKHQTINKPQASSNPLPPIGNYDNQKKLYSEGKIKAIIAGYLNKDEPLPEYYGNTTVSVTPNRIEENRKEEKGREGEDNAHAREEKTPPPKPIILTRSFEKEFARPLSPMEIEKISAWGQEHSEEVIIEALKRAVLLGKHNFKYIDSILLEWHKNNIRTVQEILVYESKFKRQKLKVANGSPVEAEPPPVTDKEISLAAKYISSQLTQFKTDNPNHTDQQLRTFLNSSIFDYRGELKVKAFELLDLDKYLERGP